MKKRQVFGFFIVLVLVSSIMGCGGGSDNNNDQGDLYYRRGSDGLVLDFLSETTDVLYENERDIEIVAEIRNEGAFPQSDDLDSLNGRIWVSGFDRDILDLSPRNNFLSEDELEGKSPYNRRGGFSSILVEGDVLQLPEGLPSLDQTIKVSATYEYKTIANPEVCIDPEPRSTKIKERVCRVRDYSTISLSNQGAPVAVTGVDEEVTSEGILFKIYVRNVGDGRVIDRTVVDQDPNAMGGYERDEVDEVYISEINLGVRPMSSCKPDVGEYLELYNDEGVIYCKMSSAGIDNVYISPLNIILKYGYLTTEYHDIKIREEVQY